MIQIENFVLNVCHQEDVNFSWLRQQLSIFIPAFWFQHNPQYQYSHAIQAFAQTIQMLSLPKQFRQEELTSHMLRTFSMQLRYNYFAPSNLEQQLHRSNEQHNCQSLENSLNRLMEHYAKLLFVRMDLYFSAEAQVDLTIHRCHQYLQNLLNRLSNRDGCFQDLHWWAWALEQGAQRGYHIHLLLVYDGNKHQNDEYLALQVGLYWKEKLTAGEGEFYTANQKHVKAHFRIMGSLGIGMIHRNCPTEVNNALAAARYLVSSEKNQQMLRVKLPNMRTFGTAQLDVNRRRGLKV
ncbi:inovirus-type Gp2 protein [Acinetobacter sp. MB5]|uniref:YagK/YfjJ domain-containing protein n=1 Tax=Acinetobacter sp. MB5 TaxID=2069438 RepID=UPI0013A69CEC|nr:inovirus-type Gp2 protein [Acinetobacter sp. MB5]